MTDSIDEAELSRRLQFLVAHTGRGASVLPVEVLPSDHPPTLGQLAGIALAFGVPSGYLTGAIPPDAIEAQLHLLSALRAWEELRWRGSTSAFGRSIGRPMIDAEDHESPTERAPACTRMARAWQTYSREAAMSEARSRSRQRLLRRCTDIVRELDEAVGGIPRPFEMTSFLRALSEYRGNRPIEALPLPAGELPTGLCGLWVAYSDHDVIGYPASATQAHRDHIVLHEVGHMVAEHDGTVSLGEPALSQLFPNLDPEMVRAVLGRSVYSAVEEQEAELIASLIMHRSLSTRSRPRGQGSEVDAVAYRLERTFG